MKSLENDELRVFKHRIEQMNSNELKKEIENLKEKIRKHILLIKNNEEEKRLLQKKLQLCLKKKES